MKNRRGWSCRLRMWACEGLSGKGVSGICEGTQKSECWGAATNWKNETLSYGRHLYELHGGFRSGIRLAVWSTEYVRVKGIASVSGACLSLSVGVSLYLQKPWTFRWDLVEWPLGGTLRTEEAHFSAVKTWVLLLSSPSSVSHCAINFSSISCFTQKLCNDFWIW